MVVHVLDDTIKEACFITAWNSTNARCMMGGDTCRNWDLHVHIQMHTNKSIE